VEAAQWSGEDEGGAGIEQWSRHGGVVRMREGLDLLLEGRRKHLEIK